MKIRHVVFSHYSHFRWYFIDTQTQREYFLSVNPFDLKYLLNGINLLFPPFSRNHIKGNWS